MNNFVISAKRFITNKNTVTIIGVLIILLILYYGYQSTINNAVNPVKVPTAAKLIGPQTEITVEDIKWIEVPSISKPSNVVLNESQIVGKYTAINATIPAGSMFYADVLVEKDQLPGTWLDKLRIDPITKLKDVPYYTSVNIVTTYGNSIQPDDYVDFYMKAKSEDGSLMFGKLIENVQILAVKDSGGEDVFTSVDDNATPAFLFFGLEDELHLLLRKAYYLSNIGVEIVVVPTGIVPDNPTDAVMVSSLYLRDFINAYSYDIPTNEEWMDMTLDGDGEIIVELD